MKEAVMTVHQITDQQSSRPPEQAPRAAWPGKRHLVIIAALLGAVLFQLAFVSSFTGADARPALQDVTIGRVGQSAMPAGHAAPHAASPHAASPVSFQPLPSAAAAREAVSDGRLPAALIVTGSHQTLVVAEAAGLTLTAAVEQLASVEAAATHSTLAVEDVRPLPAGDPHGFATYLLVLGWIIGGYLGMTLLSRLLKPRGVRGTVTLTAWTALYALMSGGLGVVLVDPVMGLLTGHPWPLLGAGTLIVFGAAMTTAALMSLLGLSGIVVAIVAFVVLGNPTSGGSVPVQMLSSGWRFLSQVLPNHAGISVVRGVQYFGGNQIGHPLLVLALYAAIPVAVCFGWALLRRPRPSHVAIPATPSLTGATQ
jgi:hypothetical protein